MKNPILTLLVFLNFSVLYAQKVSEYFDSNTSGAVDKVICNNIGDACIFIMNKYNTNRTQKHHIFTQLAL
jgi:hypothetical protein